MALGGVLDDHCTEWSRARLERFPIDGNSVKRRRYDDSRPTGQCECEGVEIRRERGGVQIIERDPCTRADCGRRDIETRERR